MFIYAVTEDNDDVQVTPRGQGTPNTVAYVFTPGADGFIDTIAGGDDWLAPVPIGERPPGYDARSRRVFTGENGLLETMPAGDDERFESENSKREMLKYAPVTEFSHGLVGAVCVTSGANLFLDTLVDSIRTDDQEVEDPANPGRFFITAGINGRCDTDALNTDIAPPVGIPNPTNLLNYSNSIIWGRQANVFLSFPQPPGATIVQITANFDLDRNGRLARPSINAREVDAILAAGQTTNAIDMYYVGMRIQSPPGVDEFGAFTTFNQQGAPFIFVGSFGLTNEIAAHEIGHALGRRDTTTARTRPQDDHSPEPLDLMYDTDDVRFTQCRVRKPDWDLISRFQ